MSGETILKVEGIGKDFGAVTALADLTLDFRAGEVLALVGENGAGKSTLMRLIEGVFPPSAGRIVVDGAEVAFSGPSDAHDRGIRVIHQEPEIVPHMSVAENIYLGHLPKMAGVLLDQRKLNRMTSALLAEFGMANELSPHRLCEGLGPAQRQMIEIMRAVHAGGRLIAFDEPTSSLTDDEARRLFKIIDRLRESGVAVIYISHRLVEVKALANRVAVLRDGRLVDVVGVETVTEEKIGEMMVGRALSDLYPPREATGGPVVLKVDGMTTDHVTDISFELKAGEVLGIGGLMGAGRSELAKGIFGFHRRKAGTVTLNGKALPSGDTAAAIEAGIGFAPEDRKEEALLLMQSILDNAVLCIPDKVSTAGFYSRGKALSVIREIASRLSVKAPSLDTPVSSLSGGNQQKVVLTRWLAAQPSVLILDEPTRGIDVGAKGEIYQTIRALTENGLGVIVISSEMPELIGMSDRILVMSDGRIRAEFSADDVSETAILKAAMPHGETARPLREELA